ncbi:MAG TPA: YbaB/EbfC family nucleoid-associated protein [Candidatus Hydrogenedentes bacterium]|nr:MAG: Nucleoid-associated protein [Candidatus Hydrogenedentes bacterium ADurb.Bin179]HOH31327.1 YbaB/EbfC family nucleoid-associated protein [Candidatus Hydrogenedentota bacterium]
MLKGLGDIGKMGGIIKQALEMKSRIEELKQKLADEMVEFSVAGEVTVTVNGNLDVLSVKIKEELLRNEDVDTIEALLCAAVNGAVGKARDMVKAKMTELTGNVDIPGLM